MTMILDWLRRKPESAARGADSLSRMSVRERLASERSARLLSDALERFPELEPEQAQVLVQSVVEDFFYEVMDLGASESYHHAGPWGLAEHSLEVAVHALRIARSRHFVGHAAPNPEEETYRLPRLRYACFLFALYHDLGKVLQASVPGPNRETHNPFVEPLGAFYDRHGQDQCRVQWREGRGLEDHVRFTPYLAGRLLPRAVAGYLGPAILAELLEEKTSGTREIWEIIAESDQHSVREDRRRAEAKAASVGAGFASGSFVSYLAKSFAEGLRQSRLAVNVFGGDVLLGRRFAFFRYPEAVEKLVSLVKEGFGRSDVAARRLAEDEGGARFFLAKLKADEGLFIDPSTGLWKLKATVQQEGASDVKEGVLIPLAHLGDAAGPAGVFPGTISFSRPSDGSEVVIDDFKPPARAATPAVTPEKKPEPAPPPSTWASPFAKALIDEPAAPPPMPPSPRRIPATVGPPQAGIDPDALVGDLLQGILEGWLPTNIPQAQIYVSPKTTFVATPVAFIKLRERGLYPDFNPQDRTNPFLRALARLDFVQKSPENRIVYPILLGPESERPLKVVKFDTLGLLKTQEVRDQVGLWKDWERLIELPQTWKPGDAVLPEEESE